LAPATPQDNPATLPIRFRGDAERTGFALRLSILRSHMRTHPFQAADEMLNHAFGLLSLIRRTLNLAISCGVRSASGGFRSHSQMPFALASHDGSVWSRESFPQRFFIPPTIADEEMILIVQQ
jgi:hypothetical protein